MKQTLFLPLLACLFIFAQCKKNKNEEAQLPSATTTGAMTFGCKINGKVFVPRDGSGRPGLYCQYVNLGTGTGGGWYLNIPATDWHVNPPMGMKIGADSLLISEGSRYEFKLDNNNQTKKGEFSAMFADAGYGYLKTNDDNGSILITKFDQARNIISGTFYFTATNLGTGLKVNITEGRFDIRY